MRAIVFILLLIAFPAQAADMVMRDGAARENVVRLTQQPCHDVILQAIRDPYKELVRAAYATIDGHSYRACWAVLRGDVILQYEDGDSGTIPLLDFTRDPGV